MQIKVVQWKENVTQSGIQLSEATSVFKQGELIGTNAFPATDAAGRQGIVTIVTVRRFDDDSIMSMPAEACRFLGYCRVNTDYSGDLVKEDGTFVERLAKSE